MPQSLSQVIIHIVFSTKDRVRWLDDAIRESLHAYLATVLRDVGSQAYRVGGTDDHVHIACTLPRTVTQADIVNKVKTPSSKWLKERTSECRDFHWQKGYGVFSVSPSHLAKLIEYIDGQREHHRGRTFQEEYRAFLERYGVEYDERYVWD